MNKNIFDGKRRSRMRLRHRKRWQHHNECKKALAQHIAMMVKDEHRDFERWLDMGCHEGELTDALKQQDVAIKESILMDGLWEFVSSPTGRAQEASYGIVAGENDLLPLCDDGCDGVGSVLYLHAVSDLRGVLKEVKRVLRPDGLFVGCVFGAEHLQEWRHILLEAEASLTGGAHGRILPFIGIRDMGFLLQQASFHHCSVESDRQIIHYETVAHLLRDIRLMGESSCLSDRAPSMRRDVWQEAMRLYDERHRQTEGVAVMMEVVSFIGRA